MRNITKYFENKTIDYQKLLDYGFLKNEDQYLYEQNIYNDHFKVIITITKDKQTSKIMDLAINDEYTLVDIKNYTGNFVGMIKEEYEQIINDILKNCTTLNIFKSPESQKVIKYIKDKYNNNLEFLWEDYSGAVFRHSETKKWYGIMMNISQTKLGLKEDEFVDIINLKYPKDDIIKIIDNIHIFPAYHMNKNHWITITLTQNLNLKEIYQLIDLSYSLTL